jgi:hypothetical protein
VWVALRVTVVAVDRSRDVIAVRVAHIGPAAVFVDAVARDLVGERVAARIAVVAVDALVRVVAVGVGGTAVGAVAILVDPIAQLLARARMHVGEQIVAVLARAVAVAVPITGQRIRARARARDRATARHRLAYALRRFDRSLGHDVHQVRAVLRRARDRAPRSHGRQPSTRGPLRSRAWTADQA